MATLEKRIEALEQASDTSTDMVILVYLPACGEADKEIERMTHGDHEWKRQPNESEQALKRPRPTGVKAKPARVNGFSLSLTPSTTDRHPA